MKLEDKIAESARLIANYPATKMALLCSFGKDSMVLLHLIRETLPISNMSCHRYPIPIIFYRHPFFPWKNWFADGVIGSWALEVHDYLPVAAGIKCNSERLELVARYSFGDEGTMDLPMNTEPPMERRDFLCGLNDWVLRPKALATTFPWETVFMGHKSSDIDQFEGHVPLGYDCVDIGGTNLVFPLRDWSDVDIWDYIETNHVPYHKGRYQNRVEIADKWSNPDYVHACTRCIDPRNKAERVYCPKLETEVENVGRKVARLEGVPEYVQKEEAKC